MLCRTASIPKPPACRPFRAGPSTAVTPPGSQQVHAPFMPSPPAPLARARSPCPATHQLPHAEQCLNRLNPHPTPLLRHRGAGALCESRLCPGAASGLPHCKTAPSPCPMRPSHGARPWRARPLRLMPSSRACPCCEAPVPAHPARHARQTASSRGAGCGPSAGRPRPPLTLAPRVGCRVTAPPLSPGRRGPAPGRTSAAPGSRAAPPPRFS